MEDLEGHARGSRMRAVARLLAAAVSIALTLLAHIPPAAANAGSGMSGCDHEGCDATATVDDRRDGGRRARGDQPEPAYKCTYSAPLPAGDYEVWTPDGKIIEIDGKGEWYERVCTWYGVVVTRQAAYLHIADPIELRQEARQRLAFPRLPVELNPTGEQTVNFRSLLWISPAAWVPVTVTAAVPGVTVTVTATPVSVTWSMGDGSEPVVCNGPGVPYDPNKSEDEQDTSCSYVYRHSGDYQLTTTVQWALSWSVTGAPGGGQLGTETSTSTPIPVHVVEVQGVGTPPGNS